MLRSGRDGGGGSGAEVMAEPVLVVAAGRIATAAAEVAVAAAGSCSSITSNNSRCYHKIMAIKIMIRLIAFAVAVKSSRRGK